MQHASTAIRLRLEIDGTVQGVGLRPFLARVASELKLAGFVRNTPYGVELEVEGTSSDIERFRARIESERPPACCWSTVRSRTVPCIPSDGSFHIAESTDRGEVRHSLSVDLAVCDDCVKELLDPSNRRFRYPFISCTQCGPRYSIAERIPFDRATTSMRGFSMCAACEREYRDPSDRRFHAQTIACDECGPRVSLWDGDGVKAAERDNAVEMAIDRLRRGEIVAVKGIGGFHLMADASNEVAISRLRDRKLREAKPLAVMFPSVEVIRTECEVSHLEAELLSSPRTPIVPFRRRESTASRIAPNVAPGNPLLGCFLPYTPLHVLLLSGMGSPVVATSGNRSEELICWENDEALARLRGVADFFLVHDRPIIRPIDDSVVRVVMGREMVLRAARGYAPIPISLSEPPQPITALGAQQKSAIAITCDTTAHVQPHLGDLDTVETIARFRRVARELPAELSIAQAVVACDTHPDYVSTRFAEELAAPIVRVQHHHAHILSCCADNEIGGTVLGVAWDGTGWGPDGTIWGGEFLLADEKGFDRVAHLRTFPLPGGDRAAREPRRAALGVLYEGFGDAFEQYLPSHLAGAFARGELRALSTMLEQNVNSPRTSSVGRLFDAVAALCGLRFKNQFEGQAASDLEFASTTADSCPPYSFPLRDDGVLDWRPLLDELLTDVHSGVSLASIARRFHLALAEGIVAVAQRVRQPRVILTGGCFQNATLLAEAVERLSAAGFQPYWHRRIPPNDGGIALGQIVAAAAAYPRG